MTISTQTASTYYIGDGVTTQFPVPFQFNDNTHLTVTLVTIATGAGTVLAPGQYTVTGAGNADGGQITYTPAIASTQKLVIQRNMPFTQELDLEREGGLFVEDVETQLDKIVMMVQQVRAELSLAAGNGQISSIVQNVTGPASSVADRIATFSDSAGNRIKDSGKTLADYALASHTHPEIFQNKQKTSDLLITSSTTLASDADLQFAVAANTLYIVNARIYLQSPNTGGIKIGITGPATPTSFYATMRDIDDSGAVTQGAITAYGTIKGTALSVRRYMVDIMIRLYNGANAGTLALQFAQNVSSANATTIYAGSYLSYKAVA